MRTTNALSYCAGRQFKSTVIGVDVGDNGSMVIRNRFASLGTAYEGNALPPPNTSGTAGTGSATGVPCSNPPSAVSRTGTAMSRPSSAT